MFFLNARITGNALPKKTLCLTFDDGPGLTSGPGLGPRTDELGLYLFRQGIQATFFLIGEAAAAHPDLLQQLERWGHLVANHTWHHPDLALEPDAEKIRRSVWDAHLALQPASHSDSLLFRPPYGGWNNDVAGALNGDSNTRTYTGPIHWDITGQDWEHWQNGDSAQVCADDYFNLVQAAQSGIILMHDGSAEPGLAAKNNTFEMTRLLIPRLLNEGYRFIRLDAVPQVCSALQVTAILAIKARTGKYVSPKDGGGGRVFVNGPAISLWEELGLVDLGSGKAAIRCPNGQFLSTQPTGDILGNGPAIDQWETFNLVPSGPDWVLQAYTGKYVSVSGTDSSLNADQTIVGQGTPFSFETLAGEINRHGHGAPRIS